MWHPSGVPFMTVPTALGLWWHSPCFTHISALTHTRLTSLVTAVTFAGAGPQTGRRGPREPQAAIVLSPRKPGSLCQTCFSVCFLFYVFNVGKGGMFPLSCPPSSPTLLLCVIPPPPRPIFPSPPTNPSRFVSPLCLLTPSTVCCFPPPILPLEIIICKALCLDSSYLCRGVAASFSLIFFLFFLICTSWGFGRNRHFVLLCGKQNKT